MGKIEQVIRGIFVDLTSFRSGHVTFIGGGFTTPSPWDIIDNNKSYSVI